MKTIVTGYMAVEDAHRASELRPKNLRELDFINGSTCRRLKLEIYKDEGYQLMGAAFEVYNDRGYGLGEDLYQECLEIELELRGIPFTSRQELKCSYKGRELRKRYIPDLLVFNFLVVELKAVSQLLPEHEAQLINYLRITRQPVGYLINFGSRGGLEWKHIILSEFIPQEISLN